MVSNDVDQYFNIRTLNFVELSTFDYFEEENELREDIDWSDDYIKLPSQFDIDEYIIMLNFVESLDNVKISDDLQTALRNKRPY